MKRRSMMGGGKWREELGTGKSEMIKEASYSYS